MKSLLLLLTLMIPVCAFAEDPINVAGVYEYDGKPDGVRKQMYLMVDFTGQDVSDFTQIFTEKEANFRRLPKDFMNAKKITKKFSGTHAPGFGKYKEKFLFSTTEEFKITNPRNDDGVIIADWINANGDKGECQIVANPDRSIRIFGLTTLSRDMSPDEIELEMVGDLLPKDVKPFVTPRDVADFMIKEYDKMRISPKVTSFDNEVQTEIVKAEQKGDRIEVKIRMKNKTDYENLIINVAPKDYNNTFAETKDGELLKNYTVQTTSSNGEPSVEIPKGKWVTFSIIFNGIDKRIDNLSSLRFGNYLPGGFFNNNPITVIENIPVFQKRPKRTPAN